MTAGGQTPEELQTLLQDALLLRDAEALAQLFDDAGVLVAGHGRQQIRGPGEIVSAWLRWQHQRGYLADPRRVFHVRDTALLLGDGVVTSPGAAPTGDGGTPSASSTTARRRPLRLLQRRHLNPQGLDRRSTTLNVIFSGVPPAIPNSNVEPAQQTGASQTASQ